MHLTDTFTISTRGRQSTVRRPSFSIFRKCQGHARFIEPGIRRALRGRLGEPLDLGKQQAIREPKACAFQVAP